MNFLAFRLDFVAFVIWHGWFQAVPFGSTRDSATGAGMVDESPSQSTRFDLLVRGPLHPSIVFNHHLHPQLACTEVEFSL
jgi:hypothetical protein